MIWLLRHADAAEGSPDSERPLTEKGEKQSRAAGAAFRALELDFDACVTSPKLRARQTAQLACEPLGLEPSVDERLAGGPFDPEDVAGGLGENVLLVGHDPDFSLAVHRMTGAQVRLPKGAVAGVDSGELKLLLRPRELRLLAQTG